MKGVQSEKEAESESRGDLPSECTRLRERTEKVCDNPPTLTVVGRARFRGNPMVWDEMETQMELELETMIFGLFNSFTLQCWIASFDSIVRIKRHVESGLIGMRFHSITINIR